MPGATMWLGTPGTNFVLDHNEIYNLINDTNGDIHDECVRLSDISHVRFTRNHLWGCFVMDVFVTEGRFFDALFENNVFEAPTGSVGNSANAIFFAQAAGHCHDPLQHVRLDRGDDPRRLDLSVGGGLTVVGNYFDKNPPCGAPNTTYAYNVTPRRRFELRRAGSALVQCFDASRRVREVLPVQRQRRRLGAAARGLPAASRQPLINRGNRAMYPRRDRTGAKRFRGRAPDIGAYESPY